MSLFASLTKKPKLDAAVKKAAKALQSEESTSDQLLKEVYQDFADVMTGDALRADTLYQWGVTLLRQAKSKNPPESINIYRNAIAKFSFCMTLDPNYLAAAIDAGVACMDLARARDLPPEDELYEMAKKQFEKANSIQSGVAGFNLACVYGVYGDDEACLASLNMAKEKGNLPDDNEILADLDLAGMIEKQWFKDFMVQLEEDRRIAEEKRIAEKAAAEEAKKPKPKRNMDTYDPYKPTKKADDKEASVENSNEGENVNTQEGALPASESVSSENSTDNSGE